MGVALHKIYVIMESMCLDIEEELFILFISDFFFFSAKEIIKAHI